MTKNIFYVKLRTTTGFYNHDSPSPIFNEQGRITVTKEYRQYAEQLKNKKLFELEELYQTSLDTYAPLFQTNFRQICETIVTLQSKKELGEISYLEYTLLFSNLIRKEYAAEVRVYDENWYYDAAQRVVGSFDFSSLFSTYIELRAELMSSRKRFAGVTAQETVSFLLSCASQFYKYVVSVFRFSILPCIEAEPFLSMRRSAEFEINVGEYMGRTEAIYKENKNRQSQKALDWFRLREEYDYAFEDFRGLDFSGADLSEIDLRYSNLSRTTLIGTDFQDSMLFGTRFCNACLRHADFRYCLLHESDFTGADLTDACFSAAKAYRGVPNHSKWTMTGYRSVSFRNANLTNADFTRTRIQDADFSGAVMDGTVIERKLLDRLSLSPEQLQAVKLVDE